MFKIISKKEYERLKRCEEDERSWAFMERHGREITEENKRLKERNKFLENELDGVSHALQTKNGKDFERRQELEKYKRLYYDEYQKRVELVEIVKRMEDAEGKDEGK